jgi:hypothetical protein
VTVKKAGRLAGAGSFINCASGATAKRVHCKVKALVAADSSSVSRNAEILSTPVANNRFGIASVG